MDTDIVVWKKEREQNSAKQVQNFTWTRLRNPNGLIFKFSNDIMNRFHSNEWKKVTSLSHSAADNLILHEPNYVVICMDPFQIPKCHYESLFLQ